MRTRSSPGRAPISVPFGIQGTGLAPALCGRSRGAPVELLRGRRFVWLVEPDVEEVLQAHSAVTLGESDELRRRHVPVAVLGSPVAQDLEERVVPDLLAQRLERHGAPVVDRAIEEEGGRSRI